MKFLRELGLRLDYRRTLEQHIKLLTEQNRLLKLIGDQKDTTIAMLHATINTLERRYDDLDLDSRMPATKYLC